MKGQKKITVDGKEYEIKFTLGVYEDLQEYLDEQGIEDGIQEALSQMKHLRFFISKMVEYAGGDIDAEELKKMEISEVKNAVSILTEATEDIPQGKGKAGK